MTLRRLIRRGILIGLFGGFVGFLYGGGAPMVLGYAAGFGFGYLNLNDPDKTWRDAVIPAGIASLFAAAGSLFFDLVAAPAGLITAHSAEVSLRGAILGVVIAIGVAYGMSRLAHIANRGRVVQIVVAMAAISLIAFPFVDRLLGLQWVASIIFAEIFVLLALGLNVVVGYAGLLDLGYAAFFAIGAYSTALLASPVHNQHINFWILIWVSAAAAAIAGIVLGAPTLGLRGDYLAIVTLGFGEIVPVAANQLIKITLPEPFTCLIIPTIQGIFGEATVRCRNLLQDFNLTSGVKGVNPVDRPFLPIIRPEELQSATGLTFVKLVVMLGVMAFVAFMATRTWQKRGERPRWTYLVLGVAIASVLFIFVPIPRLGGLGFFPGLVDGTLDTIQPGSFRSDNPTVWYFLILALVVLSTFLIRRLRDSRLGRAWTAMREDELAAHQMGINLVHTKLLAFAMGASFSGFAGAFYAAYVSGIFPTAFEFATSIIVLSSVVLGGLGNIRGVIVGTLMIMLNDVLFLKRFQFILSNLQTNVLIPAAGDNFALKEFIRANLDPVKYRFLLFGLVLVLVMSFRPEGLLPSKERAAELHSGDETEPLPQHDTEVPSDEQVEFR